MIGKTPPDRFEPRWVPCPACKGKSRYASDNPFRPFCSARCRNLDLGDWASENYRIGAKPSTEDEARLPPDSR